MPKIVVTNNQDFSVAQKARLDGLGEVTYYDTVPASAEEYLQRVKGADIICSGTAGLQDAYTELKDVYVTVAFVSVAFLTDQAVLKQHNVTVSNAPGANRAAVAEWVMAMLLLLSRDLLSAINRQQSYRQNGSLPPITPGLAGKRLTVLGNGFIGKQVSELATAFGMQVCIFRRGDDLLESVRDADIVVDVLSSNDSTLNLLDAAFFAAMKQGSFFVSVSRSEIIDEDALLQALNAGQLAGAALDFGGSLVGDTQDASYQKFLDHAKVLVTPHIAYSSEMSRQTGADIMIDNVEAWIQGHPQNIVI